MGSCHLGGEGTRGGVRSALEGFVLLVLQVGTLRLEGAGWRTLCEGERKARTEKEECTIDTRIHCYGPSAKPWGPTLCWALALWGSQHRWEESEEVFWSKSCSLLSLGGQVAVTSRFSTWALSTSGWILLCHGLSCAL